MKKLLFFAIGLLSTTAIAQTGGRVGINTERPRATLDIVGKPFNGTEADKKISRGVILPHISDAEKAKFTDKTEGLIIWNTTKKCVDYWDGTKWQCFVGVATLPAPTTYTGQAIWGDDSGESISVSRNNCPAGQTTTPITYPANTSQRITYTATSTISQTDANQKALELMNSTEKQRERQTLAQNYANVNGTCSQQTFTSTKVGSYSQSFTKNNCTGRDITGSTVTYTQRATASATSNVSQAEADRLASEKARAEARKRVIANGQEYANTNGECIYSSSLFTCNASNIGRRITIAAGGKSLTYTCKVIDIKQSHDGSISRGIYEWTNHPGNQVIDWNHTAGEIMLFARDNSYPPVLYLGNTAFASHNNQMLHFINTNGNPRVRDHVTFSPYYSTTHPKYGYLDEANKVSGSIDYITLHWLNKTIRR